MISPLYTIKKAYTDGRIDYAYSLIESHPHILARLNSKDITFCEWCDSLEWCVYVTGMATTEEGEDTAADALGVAPTFWSTELRTHDADHYFEINVNHVHTSWNYADTVATATRLVLRYDCDLEEV